MPTQKLTSVKIADFREFLKKVGCKKIRTKGGHEVWARKDLLRPIIVQTHVEPVPEFIIQNALRNLKLTKKDFFKILFDVS
jgi:predicted RNA binding protein YcfA (HicA-like mRNA interferase family)